MAGTIKRFPVEKYASLELNQVAFPKTGMVISQLPLSTEFTTAAPCENGMWVSANKGNGAIKLPAAATTTPLGIVYTAEKEYDSMHYGLKNFCKVAGDYARVGILGVGDTVTSNCFQYDTDDFDDDDDLFEALEAINTTPVYVKASTTGIPQLCAAAPQTGAYAIVTKFYTVPNGEKGVKYEMLRV